MSFQFHLSLELKIINGPHSLHGPSFTMILVLTGSIKKLLSSFPWIDTFVVVEYINYGLNKVTIGNAWPIEVIQKLKGPSHFFTPSRTFTVILLCRFWFLDILDLVVLELSLSVAFADYLEHQLRILAVVPYLIELPHFFVQSIFAVLFWASVFQERN